jgi:hypothetical protein
VACLKAGYLETCLQAAGGASAPSSDRPTSCAERQLLFPGTPHLSWHNIVTCTPIARQRVGKQVPEKTDSWQKVRCWVT